MNTKPTEPATKPEESKADRLRRLFAELTREELVVLGIGSEVVAEADPCPHCRGVAREVTLALREAYDRIEGRGRGAAELN